MKAIIKLFCMVVLFSPTLARAQGGGPPEIGFIRVVNVVAPGSGNTMIKLNGESIYKKGYTLGQRTGGIGVRAGSHEISIEKEGVEPGTTRFQIETGETLSLVAFAERVPPEEPDDPPVWQIRILRLKQSDPERGFRASFVSVCDTPVVRVEAAVLGQGEVSQVSVNRLDISALDLGTNRGEVLVRGGEEIITTISPDSPGNYVVILYEDAEGILKAISFYDPKFVIAG